MIINGKILRIDRVTGATATGTPLYSTGDALAIPCNLGNVTGSQKLQMSATIKEASKVCYLDKTALAAALIDAPGLGDRMLLQADGEDAWTGQVLEAPDYTMPGGGGISHWELFVKAV